MKLSIELDAIFSFNFHDKGSLYTISWEELEAFFIVLLYPWKTHNNFCYILQHLTFELMNRKTVIIEKLSSYYVVARTKTRSSLLWKSSFFHLSLSVSLALVLSTSRRIIPLSSRPSFHRSSPARINDAADRKVLRATPCEWELRKKVRDALTSDWSTCLWQIGKGNYEVCDRTYSLSLSCLSLLLCLLPATLDSYLGGVGAGVRVE